MQLIMYAVGVCDAVGDRSGSSAHALASLGALRREWTCVWGGGCKYQPKPTNLSGPQAEALVAQVCVWGGGG